MAQAAELEPALVLCDALLEGPDGMDGLELLFRIRADSTTLPQRIPVVLLAGEAGSPGVMEAKRLGVDGFLVKPVPAKRQIGRASWEGKSVSVRVDLGGRRILKKK